MFQNLVFSVLVKWDQGRRRFIAIDVLLFLHRQSLPPRLSCCLLVCFKFFNVIESVLQWECSPTKHIIFRISIKDVRGSAAVGDVFDAHPYLQSS